MTPEWLPRAFVLAAIAVVMALFRWLAPAPPEPKSIRDYKHHQEKEPLPPGAIGATMWGIAICIGLCFFLLRWMNHVWGDTDGPALLRVYTTSFLWAFLPGFAALAIPWPLTIWLLRRLGRNDEADSITAESDAKGGMDMYRVMKWFSYGFVGPIAFFTVLALPMHLSLAEHEARLGHYAQWSPEVFRYEDAVGAYSTHGFDRKGVEHAAWNLVIVFKDGRKLHANAENDGGEKADERVVRLLIQKTGLVPVAIEKETDIPAR